MKKFFLLKSVIFILFLSIIVSNFIGKINNNYLSQNIIKELMEIENHEHNECAILDKGDCKKGDLVGVVTIPRLGLYNEKIYYGLDGKDLVDSISTAGYIGGWGMFGDKEPSTIGAHDYELFRNLENMQVNDIIIVENYTGIFKYKVIGTMVFDNVEDDWIKDVYAKSEDYSVTLMTCHFEKQEGDMFVVFSKAFQ